MNQPSAAADDEILQKIVYHAARANIRAVWVGGRCVHGEEPGG